MRRTIPAVVLLTLAAAHAAHAQSINIDIAASWPTPACKLTCSESIRTHVVALAILERKQATMTSRENQASPINVTPLHPKLVLLAGGALDAISTARFLAAGQPEDNAALQFLNGHPERMIPIGLGFGAAYAFAYDLIHRVSPTLATGFAGTLGAFHAGLAAHNFNMERQAPSVELINDQLMIRTHPIPR